MNIMGLDSLVFGTDEIQSCNEYFSDFGLIVDRADDNGGCFKALDGTSVVIKRNDDPSLPPALPTGASLRKTVYGVADQETLNAIAEELGRDREVKHLDDGSIETVDDMGFVLGFQKTVRQAFEKPAEKVNAPGDTPQRGVNVVGADSSAELTPRSLSHVVYFVPDVKKAEAFYVERLGFRVVDRFTELGPFLRPQGTLDHHTLFLVDTPPSMQGVEHFTFHMGGPTEVFQIGKRFQDKGYETFWGPGRHIFGSNWFWYFNCPLGVHFEVDADMDLHDDTWTPREAAIGADASQIFNFTLVENWQPGGD